jgi:hypothetical protein
MGMMASRSRASRCLYSLYSIFGVLAMRISVSAARRSSLRTATKPSCRRRHHRCWSRNATNFGSLNSAYH